jgi:hypothetical protein
MTSKASNFVGSQSTTIASFHKYTGTSASSFFVALVFLKTRSEGDSACTRFSLTLKGDKSRLSLDFKNALLGFGVVAWIWRPTQESAKETSSLKTAPSGQKGCVLNNIPPLFGG